MAAYAIAKDIEMLNFSGKLYGSSTGYLMVQVPNALATGAFYALPVSGLVLPGFKDKPFNAHITVMRPDEVQRVGGMEKINERGRDFRYAIVGGDSVPSGSSSDDYSRYWFLKVQSAELAELRRTYGLPSEPAVPFHITFAARPRHVLRDNGISKLTEAFEL